MSEIPESIKTLLNKHGLNTREGAWELPQKKGTWILKHKTIERLAALEGVVFELPQTVLVTEESAVVLVRGMLGDKAEWSYGEATPKNNKNSYPVAMAEKRAKDRVVLKLLGLHGDAYSEDEADDFKEDISGKGGLAEFGFSNFVTRNEYFELLEMALNTIEHKEALEEMKPYFSRLSKTDEQIRDQLLGKYKAMEKMLTDKGNYEESNNRPQ